METSRCQRSLNQRKLRFRRSTLFRIPGLPILLLQLFFCDFAISDEPFLLLPSSPRYPEFEFVLSTKLRKRRLRNRFSASHSFSARATLSLLDKSPPKKFHRLERALSLQQRWRNPTSSLSLFPLTRINRSRLETTSDSSKYTPQSGPRNSHLPLHSQLHRKLLPQSFNFKSISTTTETEGSVGEARRI